MLSNPETALARVASAAAKPDAERRLQQLLRESAGIYRGLSSGQAEWLRGQIYAALAQCQCGPDSTRAAAEDLSTSYNPILLSGAARCLAAQQIVEPAWVESARAARQRIALRDVYPDIRFSAPGACCSSSRTALAELNALIDRDDTEKSNVRSETQHELVSEVFALCPTRTSAIAFRDQDNERLTFTELFDDKAALIAFFYTRCMNPQKCSLTISRLGEAARQVARQETAIGCFGITYDPRFDTSPRLAAYGHDRRFPFSNASRLLRCTSGWSILRDIFGLRVGFGASVINGHARELFIVNRGKHAKRCNPDAVNESPMWLAHGMMG